MNELFKKNKEEIQNIKEYEKKVITPKHRNIVFTLLSIVVFSFIVIFSSQILSGIATTIALVILSLVLIFGYRILKAADPLIKQKIKNESLKAMYKEASKNAIYQLDNSIIDKKEKIKKAMRKRDEIGGQLKSLEAELNKTKQDPDLKEAVPQMEKMYITVEKSYKLIIDNIQQAKESFSLWEKEVKIYKVKQKFSDSAESIMSAIDSNNSLADKLTIVAMESIDDSFNNSMTAIENLELDANFK